MILGMEDIRTDVIIFASIDLDNKTVNGISVPRDTYIHRKGFDGAEQRKINAIYGEHGIKGVKKALSYILEGVPIHHYIIVDYEGVKHMVDAIGGGRGGSTFYHEVYRSYSGSSFKYIYRRR